MFCKEEKYSEAQAQTTQWSDGNQIQDNRQKDNR